MKFIKYLLLSSVFVFTNCTDIIEGEPESYTVNNGTYTVNEAQSVLLGAYASLRDQKTYEWALTEILSDNTYNNYVGSSELKRLQVVAYDTFNYDNSDTGYYLGPYWLSVYTSIRAANTVIKGVGYSYDSGSKSLKFSPLKMTEAEAKVVTAEACFIRAYNYFNLVRMFGSVPLVDVPFENARDAYNLPLSSTDKIYDLIITDLKFAVDNGISSNYSASSSNVGKANKWAAAGLLAKVYLTRGDKASAKTQLESIIGTGAVSDTGAKGYGLESSYSNVFSTGNEMNKEILFSIRYSSSNTLVGNSFTEVFAGVGQSTPSSRNDNGVNVELYNAYNAADARRGVNILAGKAGNTKTAQRFFLTKYYSEVSLSGFGPNDWPVLRYADVLLMYAEALGNTPTSVGYINQVRKRSYPTGLLATTLSDAAFENALFNERRLELAGENERWFDLLRRQATTTTGFDLKAFMKAHFTNSFNVYKLDSSNSTDLNYYLNNVEKSNFLLPIPLSQLLK